MSKRTHGNGKKRKNRAKGARSFADVQRLREQMYQHAEPMPDSFMTVEFTYDGKRWQGTARCIGEAS